jgi:hypothetical protein
MRKAIISLLSVFILVSSTSCITNKMLVSKVKPTEIKSLAYFEPISYVQLIKKGNKPILNDSLSSLTKKGVENTLLKNKNNFHLSEKLEISNDTLNRKIINEIAQIVRIAKTTKKVSGIQLTPIIDSIMESNSQRFALAIVATGFGRRKGNYGGQVAKGIGIGILTLGMYTPAPIKSSLILYGIIFDAKNNEIAFYKNTNPTEKNPTDSSVINEQFKKLFKDYFF